MVLNPIPQETASLRNPGGIQWNKDVGMKRLFPTLVQMDSNGILHNIPNTRYKKWKINSLGFRGAEIDLEKKEGQIRIVCLGASETFGYYESYGKEWPSQLGEMLRDKFPKVEVSNVSVAGQHLRKRREYVEQYVLPLKPDIMIIFHQRFFDYVRNSMRGEESEYPAKNVKGKRGKYPVQVDSCIETPIAVLSQPAEAAKKSLPERWLTQIRIRRLRRKIRQKERKYLTYREPMEEAPEEMILEYEEQLRSFAHYLKENNITPVLSTYPTLVTPSNEHIYEDLLLAYRRVFCIELSENGILDTVRKWNHAIRKIAKEQNVVLADNGHLIPKTLKYFADNCHFTDQGAEMIARNCYDVLTQHHLIK